MLSNKLIKTIKNSSQKLTLSSCLEGMEAMVLCDIVHNSKAVVHIAKDDYRARALIDSIGVFGNIGVIDFPAWDCLPFDRVSPNHDVLSRRAAALADMADYKKEEKPVLIVTTINSALQKMPNPHFMREHKKTLKVGSSVSIEKLSRFLVRNGFQRVGTVRESGDFAVRGGIVDVFPPGFSDPVRLDFFGSDIENIRLFDAATQVSNKKLNKMTLMPVGELLLSKESIEHFKTKYVQTFGMSSTDDAIYKAISEGRYYQGAEHFLPLFYDKLTTLFEFFDDALITLDSHIHHAVEERFHDIDDYYEARIAARKAGAGILSYNPLPVESLYLTEKEWKTIENSSHIRQFTPHTIPDAENVVDCGGKLGRSFAHERKIPNHNLFESFANEIRKNLTDKKRVIIACYSEGSKERTLLMLKDYGIENTISSKDFSAALSLPKNYIAFIICPIENGFETEDFILYSEQDVFGERLIRKQKKKRSADRLIFEASSLSEGDFVVHNEHGIGKFLGLVTLDIPIGMNKSIKHDCILLEYQGNDKLYVPVENIELLTRYGSQDTEAICDRLGGVAWQAKKAKLKERIKDMADKLIKIAAERMLKNGEIMTTADGIYDDFAARFPYEETEDQLTAIDAVIEDLASGKPMDRLVCGDVGFGKTEVAIRAAFIAAMQGYQVAVVVPTTLLVRQHYKNFFSRFEGFPLKVAQLSRMVSAKEAKQNKEDMASGKLDIVIGTHALLAKTIEFKRLGLLIIDEEQHFGVAHKEKLKNLKSDVHVLTLTATPIPRTLQLAMSGVRDLSLITTPPIDRLAIRTYVTPFDKVMVREALLKEKSRGGQAFFVAPRISDLDEIAKLLREFVPEISFKIGHGQLPMSELDEIMTDFYDRKFDVLASTTIVESGIDVPSANTMIIWRADKFGLAQLYQIRGRIGRSKIRAYAYLTYPPRQKMTEQAERRLQVIGSLDSLGAGFTLASHDMDIRGGGNLLGEEQSGHIKEVGFELYQEMLEQAIASLKSGNEVIDLEGKWSPTINLGMSILIPESYVKDLDVRMGLYKRISTLEDTQDIDSFAAELIDRFGKLPQEVDDLLHIIELKTYCLKANISKIEAGAKGVQITFYKNNVANPEAILKYVQQQKGKVKLKPDQSLFYAEDLEKVKDRIPYCKKILKEVINIALEGFEYL